MSEAFRKTLRDNNLGWLEEHWTAISIATDITTLSLDSLVGLVKRGKQGVKVLEEAGYTDEAKLLSKRVDEAKVRKQEFNPEQHSEFIDNVDNISRKKLTNTDNKITKPSGKEDELSKPSGYQARLEKKMDDQTRVSTNRENEAAKIFAKKGYKIEQRPDIKGTSRKPDYLIEGKVFDCYAPYKNDKDARGIWKEVYIKVVTKKQTKRVVLNLKYLEGSFDDLQKQFSAWKIEGLEEVIYITSNDNIKNLKL